jgi:hypothetical protein
LDKYLPSISWSAQLSLAKEDIYFEESQNTASERSGEQGGRIFSQNYDTNSSVFAVPHRQSASMHKAVPAVFPEPLLKILCSLILSLQGQFVSESHPVFFER